MAFLPVAAVCREYPKVRSSEGTVFKMQQNDLL